MSHSKNFGLCRPFLLSNVAMQCSELNNVEGARLEAVSLKSGGLRACRWPTEALTYSLPLLACSRTTKALLCIELLCLATQV
jgi:hypothetical protein